MSQRNQAAKVEQDEESVGAWSTSKSQVPFGSKLPRSFYEAPVLEVARALIGKVLVHHSPEGVTAGRIVETEAYRGPDDRAAHSWHGRTKRTEVMFGPPGHAYMFLLYGLSWAFNIVSGREGEPHAILVRALEPVGGLELMSTRRRVPVGSKLLSNGPGKLCQALGLHRTHYGHDLCSDELYLCDGPRTQVARSPRINIDYAGAWAQKPWRFVERANRFVSVPPR